MPDNILIIGTEPIPPGSRTTVSLEVGHLITHEPVRVHVNVIRGRKPGPRLLISACLHGDEVNGIEIIRRLLRSRPLRGLRGDLIAVPVLNPPAFINRSRYMPDRRDLNRLFPGSETGSLGARIADMIVRELLSKSTHVVDLHSGAVNRPNLPQARVTPGDEASRELANAFAAPVTTISAAREGSFRATAVQKKIPMVLYESGEALRLDAHSIRFGVRGILAVMRKLEMIAPDPDRPRDHAPRKGKRRNATATEGQTVICHRSYWERASRGGLFIPLIPLGKAVEAGTTLGLMADPYAGGETPVIAARSGIVIGRNNQGHADEGDGLFHIGLTKDFDNAESAISESQTPVPPDDDPHPVRDEPFID